MKEIVHNINDANCDNEQRNEFFLELQRRKIITDYLNCALWEYNIKEKCQYQYKKLDGKWMDQKEPIYNFRETVISWGLIHPDDLNVFNDYCDSLENGESDFSYEMRMLSDENEFIWIRYTGKAICDKSGTPISVIGVTYDVTSEHEKTKDKKYNIDSVTGLLDGSCLDLMQTKFYDINRSCSSALIFIDIDDFKYVNDNLGKVFGDYVLEQVGHLISVYFNRNAIIGRLGGDQFAVFCYDFSTKDLLENEISSLQNAILSNRFKRNIELSISAGYAVLPAYLEEDFHSLITYAETALYIAKHEAKNSCHLYTEDDKSAMPPDCRQIKFTERYEGRSPLYLSQLMEHEKKLFDFAFQTINSTEDFRIAAENIFSELGKQYSLDNITLAHKYRKKEASIETMWHRGGGLFVPEGFENHIDRHWERLSSIMTMSNKMLVCDDIGMLKDDAFFNDARYKMNTKSIMLCGIYDSSALVGVIAFEHTSNYHCWTENEISVFSSVTRMISSYLLRFLSKKNLQSEILYSNAILENKDMLGYTIDPETYEITYATDQTMRSFKNLKIGDICYKTIMCNNAPCKNCPVAALNDTVKKHTVEIFNRSSNSWFSATASKINVGQGKTDFLLCLTDVTQFMDRVQSHDRLTGLLTFDKFEMEALRYLDIICGEYFIAVIKVIRFGEINDDFGFETGNKILKEIASKFIRSITSKEMVCRSNGANFFALLKADDYYKVEKRLNSLFRSIEESVGVIEPDFKLSMAAGVYQIGSDDRQFNICLDKANYALKKITNGRFINQNEIMFYDSRLDDEVMGRKEIERNMYSALNNGEFQVYYQPKVDLATEKIYGAEALVRWVKPDGKIISPGLFVPVFEENEFITEMDFYVYEVVMRDMRRLIEEGIELPIISLNVSRQHFFGDDFPDKFCSLVNKYNIPHDKIELELTETTFFSNVDHLIKIINLLRNRRGFRISVDDFGSGYSSLNLISVLPVDVLKIDGKFFMANSMSTKNKKVIEAILQLASTLDFDTVSEGVETREQVDFLKHTNCNAVQGYFYYRPMKFTDFKALIKCS